MSVFSNFVRKTRSGTVITCPCTSRRTVYPEWFWGKSSSWGNVILRNSYRLSFTQFSLNYYGKITSLKSTILWNSCLLPLIHPGVQFFLEHPFILMDNKLVITHACENDKLLLTHSSKWKNAIRLCNDKLYNNNWNKLLKNWSKLYPNTTCTHSCVGLCISLKILQISDTSQTELFVNKLSLRKCFRQMFYKFETKMRADLRVTLAERHSFNYRN